MSKILELRTKRNTLWEQTKDFLEKNRGENGLVKAEAVEQYNKMAQEVKDLGAEIERLEQQAQIEAQLSAPTSSPVHADPKNGAKVGVTAAQKEAVSFDEIFKLYYALRAPYRKKAQFLCNEALVLQLMTIKDNNGNYIWKPGLDIGKPDTLLNRPLRTSSFMPGLAAGNKAMTFGDYSYYWIADRQNRTFRRLNELYARTDQVGFMTTQRVDGKLILPEAVQCLQMKAGA